MQSVDRLSIAMFARSGVREKPSYRACCGATNCFCYRFAGNAWWTPSYEVYPTG